MRDPQVFADANNLMDWYLDRVSEIEHMDDDDLLAIAPELEGIHEAQIRIIHEDQAKVDFEAQMRVLWMTTDFTTKCGCGRCES